MRTPTRILLLAFLAASCSRPGAVAKSAPTVDGDAVKSHLQELSSDSMEGRAPGSKGEELATAYISDFFKSIGLKTQFQPVPMVGITSTVSPLELSTKTGKKTLKYANDFVAWS